MDIMEPTVIWKGSGEELLAHADEWKYRQNLELIEVEQCEDAMTRLDKMGGTWKDGIPLFPPKEGHVPATIEQIRAWRDDEEIE